MADIYDFGMILREERKRKKLTQTELGEKLGLSKTAISKYENGTAMPPVDIMRSLAKILNVSMDYLCGTEQREKISVFNLTAHQVEVVNKLVDTFRERNQLTDKKISPECCTLLGEILVELSR